MDRRSLLKTMLLGATATSAGARNLAAQSAPVTIALVAPLSGPYAKQGDLMLKGAQFAVDQINREGGVAALGGAKMQLVVADAGDTVERAKAATERLVSQNENLSGGVGAYASSFTLAATEASERASLPWITNSVADQIVGRGFKFVFQTSPAASRLARDTIPTMLGLGQAATGKRPATVGFILDNTAYSGSFAKPVRDGEIADLKLVLDETVTPPVSDATSVVQKLRSARPDFAMLLLSTTNDNKLLLEKLSEFNLGRARLPLVAVGSQAGSSDLKNLLSNEVLEGFYVIVVNWGSKRTQAVADEFKRRTGEPWMTQDSIDCYAAIHLFKTAAEAAKSADRRAVAEALRRMNLRDGPAGLYPGGHVQFDDAGRMINPGIIVLQWQKGEPVPVFPASVAIAQPVWGGR